MITSCLFADATLWKEEFLKELPSRPYYHVQAPDTTYTNVACRVLGCYLDENMYFNDLYHYSKNPHVHILTNQTINKVITTEDLRDLQELFNQLKKGTLSLKRLSAFLIGRQLLPNPSDSNIRMKLHTSYIGLLELVTSKYGLTEEWKRIFIDSIKYIKNYLAHWISNDTYYQTVPKVVWYGDMTIGQSYFLYFLTLLGFDILVFHPQKEDKLGAIDVDNTHSQVMTLPSICPVESFPTEERKIIATVANQASEEIQYLMNTDNSGLYKPWQFRNYTPCGMTLKSTYDEIFIYAKEKAFLRPHFYVEKETVYIPSFFAKISGIERNEAVFQHTVNGIVTLPYTKKISTFPFTTEITSNYQFHYQHAQRNGKLHKELIQQANWWNYKHLTKGLQDAIATAFIRTIVDTRFLCESNETEQQKQLYLFSQLTNVPADFTMQMEQFDYTQEVPKIVLLHNEDTGRLSRSDAAILLFLHNMGFDILLFNPTARMDLELYINESSMVIHQLEEVAFHFEFKKEMPVPSFISKIKNIFS